jgi:hypothetical protein
VSPPVQPVLPWLDFWPREADTSLMDTLIAAFVLLAILLTARAYLEHTQRLDRWR